MVDEILQGEFDDDLIIRHLIDDCNLIDRLVDAWFESGEAEAQGRPRKGHMGHIFKMIQLVEQLAIFQVCGRKNTVFWKTKHFKSVTV